MEKVLIELYVREHPELGDIGYRVGRAAMLAAKETNPELVSGFISIERLNEPSRGDTETSS